MTSYFDAANRDIADVNVGTNGGTAYIRHSTIPMPSDTVLVPSYQYNVAGWLQDTIDPRGIDTRTLYDVLGRTSETVTAYTDGVPAADTDQTTTYTYDGNDNTLMISAVLPAGAVQTTQYVYGVATANGSALNSNDLRAETEYPDPTTGQPSTSPSQKDTYTYNALGQVAMMTDCNGTTHAYTYDVLGRQVSDTVTTLGAGVDGSVRRIDTAYDSQGNAYLFTSYADPAGTAIVNQVQRTFNALGQLTAEYQANNGAVNNATTPVVQYGYTEISGGQNNSRLVSKTYPNGRVINYNYNTGLDSNISRLSSISDSSGILQAYIYLGLSTVVQESALQADIELTYISQSGSTGDTGDQYTGLDRLGRVPGQPGRRTTAYTRSPGAAHGIHLHRIGRAVCGP
jgi:YD repeat-containing protein